MIDRWKLELWDSLYVLYLNSVNFILGSYYQKDAGKRAKSRYNYQTGLRRTMSQYKKTTGDDIVVHFIQSTKDGKKSTFATKPDLVKKEEKRSIGSQTLTDHTDHTTTDAPSTSTTPTRSYVSPSKSKVNSSTPENANTCRKCQVRYGTKMDNQYGSMWINCDRKGCSYWAHLKCLGFVCMDEDEEKLNKIVKFYCNNHLGNLPRSKNILKKR